MNEQLIEEVVEEIRPALVGRHWGKVFQLSAASLAVDFRAGDGRYLLISVEPGQPRLHLISRTVRELERASAAPTPFALVLRKRLGGATLRTLAKDEGERVVRFRMAAADATGEEHAATLVAQLTGRTSNLFLLDEGGRVIDSMRPARGEGQEIGDAYSPPAARGNAAKQGASSISREGPGSLAPVSRAGFASLSEALDEHYRRLERERAFDARAAALASRFRQEAARLRKLRANLSRDLAAHGDAEEHKRAGDLLLANLANAERRGGTIRLQDFYAEGAPFVELEVEEGRTLQDEAARRFARYSKAKRAAREISERLKAVEAELDAVEEKRDELERVVAARDAASLAGIEGGRGEAGRAKTSARAKAQKKEAEEMRGVRRYRSSDGYEILVGRAARDNDRLTFRLARSFDTWMHAADYPGSHVVVRARSRDEQVPHRTLVEAARLAAHFSQARKDSKVAVNYTQRKFVSKPKGAAPGLVYLSSFRTLLVEPREELKRIKE
ncbi:MAG TPA: NFACT family protein [Pyrinomonadaceae bacterium]|jgi:predicted ribosome quality control (RQC) complex YloA/Tae2 family protein|nr:NFACT family protein [Pyrinomonadaceae bacterium]